MNLWQLLIFKGSRKVSFGVWSYISAHVLFLARFISAEQFMTMYLFAGSVITGGTIADRFFDSKKSDAPKQ